MNRPVEAELVGLAKKITKELKTDGKISAKKTADKVNAGLIRIRKTYDKAGKEYIRNPPKAAEWLLDNRYLAEREGKQAIEVLKKAGKLPGCGKTPVVLLMSRALCSHLDGEFTADDVSAFLNGVQDFRGLSEKEVSLFVTMLRAELVMLMAEACMELERAMELAQQKGSHFYIHRRVAKLRETGETVPETMKEQSAKAKEEYEKIAAKLRNCFTSLRLLSTADFSGVLEDASLSERELRNDPSGIYPLLDEKTRKWYRERVAVLARRRGQREYEAAQDAVMWAREHKKDIGEYLFPSKDGRGSGWYISLIILASMFLALLCGFLFKSPLIVLLLIIPISDIVKNVLDYIVIRVVKPRPVMRLELKEGIPDDGRTLCVISTLLGDRKSTEKLFARLERFSAANRDSGKNLCFGILADMPDSENQENAGEDRLIDAARDIADRLNEKHGGGFYLFFRKRSLNESEGRYIGRERKRGAIMELMRCIRGKNTELMILSGSRDFLDGVNYVITLDSDTRLSAGSARELVGAMLHPMNRPKIGKNGTVIRGYGLLQPRISVDLSSANATSFSKIYAGQGGIDPYGSTVSDVYQDLFASGSFSGKGIISVDAYMKCLDGRFPENRVLSHDLLEGEYLKTGYIGDVELTDGYPSKVISYFKRQHRWVRGDWQASHWLSSKVKNESGKWERNPLGSLSKWKIFDNLRRSLVPVFTFLALLLGMLSKDIIFAVAAAAAVLAAISNLLLSGMDLVFRRGGRRLRYQSSIIAGFGGGVIQTLLQLLLLPFHAWISFSAAVTALYRMFVSHRNLLMWVTASDMEKNTQNGLWGYYKGLISAVILGLLPVMFSPYPAAVAAGIIWIFSPWIAWKISTRDEETDPLSDADKKFLHRQAESIWRYFDDFLREEDNFLPPDNFQEQPAAGIAHRTSPTNIGLGALCILAAMDLKLTVSRRALTMLENMLDTVEKLPKWNGHLYNWYDTQTLRPLTPKCVSTVDSGNFVGCMIAMKEGLTAMKNPKCKELGIRCGKLAESMKFKGLFDEKRRLFYIGYDLEKNEPMSGRYDLMESEARQTSYIAVARGEVPLRHWERLGRMRVENDGYTGMVSWTGTMFEYLMPNLLMPCLKNSSFYESAKFCVYMQRNRGRENGVPWGISESAYYSFDAAFNYQYKAHGVQKLGLRRGLNKELVIAPYATFLALMIEPERAMRNLNRLNAMGIYGRYGMYEAVDFTPSRVNFGNKYETVYCYMAHHIGMSLIAIDNVLMGNIMQRRFMQDADMGAFAELLEEKVPTNGVVIGQNLRETPERTRRAVNEGFHVENKNCDMFEPKMTILSNSAYTVLLGDSGIGVSKWHDVSLNRFAAERQSSGIQFWLKTPRDTVSLQAAPEFDPTMEYSSVFESGKVRLSAKGRDFAAVSEITVPNDENCELREVRITNLFRHPAEFELACYFEPTLARGRDFEAHPAFSKLFLETCIRDDCLIVGRRKRGEDKPIYLAIACSERFTFDTSREKVLGRNEGIDMKTVLSSPATESAGTVLDPCVLIRTILYIGIGETEKVRFVFATARTPEAAAAAARRMLKATRTETKGIIDAAAEELGMPEKEISKALELIGKMLFLTDRDGRYVRMNRQGRRGIWKFGISGDNPIIVAEAGTNSDKMQQLIARHCFLNRCGFKSDLVILTEDGSDYLRSQRMEVIEAVKTVGAERQLGISGGVHIPDISNEDDKNLIMASAALIETFEAEENPKITDVFPKRIKRNIRSGKRPEFWFDTDGSFVFSVNGRLPDVMWSNMLANNDFGCVCADGGFGHVWYKNAREYSITPWVNDPLAVGGAEELRIRKGNNEFSVFAAEDGLECKVTFGFGFAVWEKENVRTTVFVPSDKACRVVIIEGAEGGELTWMAKLRLGSDMKSEEHVVAEYDDGAIYAYSGESGDYEPAVCMFTAGDGCEFTCSRKSYYRGEFDERTDAGQLSCAAFRTEVKDTVVLLTGCAETMAELAVLKELTEPERAQQEFLKTKAYWRDLTGKWRFETPNARLNEYINGWAVYQTLACRVMGRSSVYQSGGAYGFRDQLQDVCALTDIAPQTVRAHILNAAAHQFEEGDVLHWWHPVKNGRDKGVRTRYSDDLLWLPYTVCEYTEKTGDMTVLEERAEYLRSPTLQENEMERYETPGAAGMDGTVFEHCVKSIECALNRGMGEHGLCLIGGGDWNDGFNLVGAQGRGESVWLTWFLSHVLYRFGELCIKQGDTQRGRNYKQTAETLAGSASKAWDGKWYLRGYFDSGEPIGSSLAGECRVDAIAQGFAPFAPRTDKEKSAIAVENAAAELFNRENRVLKLLTPPFEGELSEPGYISAYPAGIRENGGQYTHGGIWLAMGCLKLDKTELGYDMLAAMLPGGRDESVYKTEPFVISADVYSNPQHLGRGGWSWYTGAAGWYFRAVTEELLGIKINNGCLTVFPKLPDNWEGFTAVRKVKNGELKIEVCRGSGEDTFNDAPIPQEGVGISELTGANIMKIYV